MLESIFKITMRIRKYIYVFTFVYFIDSDVVI